jgi:hypothetical protein
VGVAVNFVAASIALTWKTTTLGHQADERVNIRLTKKQLVPLVSAAALLGFASLAFEMISFRAISFFFGLVSYRKYFVFRERDRNHRWFIDDDTLPRHEHEGIGRSEVNTNFP